MTLPAQARQNPDNLPTPSPDDSSVPMIYHEDVVVPHVVLANNHEASDAASGPASGPAPSIQTENLPKVYEQAGVQSPNHGFTILKIADMLASAHIRDLSLEGKRSAILMALEANGVQLNDVVEDAARRDVALNQYEARQQKAFQDLKNWKQQQNREIQAEIDLLVEACRTRIEDNEKEIATEKARLDEWRQKKREEERRIRTASSHFGQNSGTEQSSGKVETPAAAETPALTSTQVRPAESRIAESPVAANGKAPTIPGPVNAAGKRLSLWKR